MATDKFPNVFVAVLKQSLSLGGSETEFYLSTVKTLDGQTVQASDFAYLGRGVLSIDVQSASRIEFASFTGVDPTNSGLTGGIRGLSFNSDDIIAANKKFHAVGAPVLIAFGTHNLIDLETIIQNNLATVEAQIAALTGIYLEVGGGNEPTANINWGGFKIINLANGTNAQDAITLAQLQAAVVAGGVPASTSQGGYVKVATTAEFNAGTNTTVVGPFTFYNMATISMVKSLYPAPSIQIFTSSGTWTKPVGTKYVVVSMVGGGGGGGSSDGNTGHISKGGGGGAINGTLLIGDLLTTVNVTVGSGGTAGTSGGAGGGGGTSSFGTYLTTNGGGGGPIADPSSGSASNAGTSTGNGIAGGNGWASNAGLGGMGGGAGGGTASNGTNTTGGIAGTAASFLGAGATGNNTGIGPAGNNYGGGGAGGALGVTVYAGGAGAPGYVIVTSYF